MKEQTVRILILGREYTLRVPQTDAGLMRDLAAMLDERMRTFRDSHPTQPEITAAVITALELAEELHLLRDEHEEIAASVDEEVQDLTRQLSQAVSNR